MGYAGWQFDFRWLFGRNATITLIFENLE
jgi:hypothetical protein